MHGQSLNENFPPKHQVSLLGDFFFASVMAGGMSGLAKLAA